MYTEVKAEHSFLEMINAAVSHELRNPLNSLIGQVCAMKQYFANFKKVISEMKKSESTNFVEKLKNIYNGLEKCSEKMSNACTFIDFFVHDILDYTILNKDSKNFIKDFQLFDIREAMDEILQILEDKS
jgi:signal transduction histidine kinase